MYYLSDLGILTLYGLLFLQYTGTSYLFVLAFLCTLILNCLFYFEEKKILSTFLGLSYMAAALHFPEFYAFSPCAVYVLVHKNRLFAVSGAIPLFLFPFFHTEWRSLSFFVSSAFVFLLTGILAVKTDALRKISENFRRTQDDSREYTLLLAEKNKLLLEKQDYEIYSATQKERNRIAREIHDNVGHVLSRSILMLGAVKTINRQKNLTPLFDTLDISLNHAMDSIRNSVHDLHDESVNLKETIESLVQEFTFCPAELVYDMGIEIPREIKYSFISITKESLSNIIRHSNADKVSIVMREHPRLYQLCITDNGTTALTQTCFFHTDSFSADKCEGMGLSNMQERVLALGGSIQITANNGFRIFITIPKTLC